MKTLPDLFNSNRLWSERIRRENPDFFPTLARQQSPKYLWIGCSDSRVPANEVVDLLPGELFVHRNVANVVAHSDLNCLSVIQFAVDVLKVQHIMVVGHYGCAGVSAALRGDRIGLSDNWLRHVQDVRQKHVARLDAEDSVGRRSDRLCELNVIEQAVNVSQTTIVRDAWGRGQPLDVHAWVYGLQDGLMSDLRFTVASPEEALSTYESAISGLT